LEEVDKFLDKYDQPKLNQEDINHLNRSITSNEIQAAIVFQNKSLGPDGIMTEFYQIFKEELTTAFLKLFHEIEREEHCQNYSMKPVLHSS
jgi:hypothetical protein